MPCGEVLAVTLVPVDGDVAYPAVRLKEDQCCALLPCDVSSEGEVEVVEHPRHACAELARFALDRVDGLFEDGTLVDVGC